VGMRNIAIVAAIVVTALSVASGTWAAVESNSAEETARFRRDWNTLLEKYERELKANLDRIAAIDAKEQRFGVEQEERAAKITKDAVSGIKAYLSGGGKEKGLAKATEKAVSQVKTLKEMYAAENEYIDIVSGDSGEGAERKRLMEANRLLQRNIGLVKAYVERDAKLFSDTSSRAMETYKPLRRQEEVRPPQLWQQPLSQPVQQQEPQRRREHTVDPAPTTQVPRGSRQIAEPPRTVDKAPSAVKPLQKSAEQARTTGPSSYRCPHPGSCGVK
jgi:hypothetical protein